MKRVSNFKVKPALVLFTVITCCLLFATTAFAATVTLTTPAVSGSQVTLTGTIDTGANQEVTILVVPSTVTDLSTVTDTQIEYIDQITTGTGGAYNLTFTADPGSYKVYVGGTDVTTPVSSENPVEVGAPVDPTPTIAVTGVTLNMTTASFKVGDPDITLLPTIAPADATNKDVTWASSNTSVATVANGVVKAIAVGTANITVTTADGSKTATCVVTVEPSVVHVTAVTLNKTSTSLTVGGATETLLPTIAPANATNQNVTWTSSNTSVATVVNGVVTAVAAGSADITATSVDNVNATAKCAVTVNPPVIQFTSKTKNPDGKTNATRVEVKLTAITDPSVYTVTVLGKSLYYSPDRKLFDGIVDSTDATAIANGITVQSGTPENIMYGDVNNDGKITLSDAAAALKVYSGKTATPTDKARIASDADGNGTITLVDVANILKLYSGKIPNLAVQILQ